MSTRTTTTPKTLLLAALDASGSTPFFHYDVGVQRQRVEAASLLKILECAFNFDEVPARSEWLAPFFARVLAAVEAGDVDTVNAVLDEIVSACLADADACLAAYEAAMN